MSELLPTHVTEKCSNRKSLLMIHISSEMEAQGITGDMAEFRRRYEQVLSGKRECPLAATCAKYRQAIEHGARMVYQ